MSKTRERAKFFEPDPAGPDAGDDGSILRMLLSFRCCLAFAAIFGATRVSCEDELSNRFGHDDFQLPADILAEMAECSCSLPPGHERPTCESGGDAVDWRTATELSFCVGKAYLLERMPKFDLDGLPPSVSVPGSSMLDDNVAFSILAQRASPFTQSLPLPLVLPYVLSYGSYHEARSNWRPLFFAKHARFVENATTTAEAVAALVSPNVFLNWSGNAWAGEPRQADGSYELKWSSSTAPPVLAPFDFVAYGYGSCSAWATLLTYTFRAVGIPARQAGTPCWNSVFSGTDFSGLAEQNPNVKLCWSGGNGTSFGGGFLNNHNWVCALSSIPSAYSLTRLPTDSLTH